MNLPMLDKNFRPVYNEYRTFVRAAAALPAERRRKIALSVESPNGRETLCFDGFFEDERNCALGERLAKALLYASGGHTIGVYGSDALYFKLKEDYSPSGARAFDYEFMSGVYERPLTVVKLDEPPVRIRNSKRVGGLSKGCRIGFDAGGSDRKVSAVVDGKAVYSEEVVWNPKTEPDPAYHRREILAAMKTAASKMPRVDGIGVSSAGVYVDNRAMNASLFLGVDKRKYGEAVKNIYLDVAADLGNPPLVVANDGDVAALAGSMELGEGNVLGIAMGTSEAAGYVDGEMGLDGRISELAFAPVDLSPSAPRDEWSGDVGVGCKYFSQDGVIRLAEAGGRVFREGLTPAQKLKEMQELLSAGDALAERVFRDVGICLGHTLPFYSLFYSASHVLLLGRVVSGRGGELILEECRRVLETEYPEEKIVLHLPTEKSRRVGQCIAAASLPADPDRGGNE